MRAVDVIRAKRDGETLTREAIDAFVQGVTTESWPDYQASALLMAIVLRGMTAQETAVDSLARIGAPARTAETPAAVAACAAAISALSPGRTGGTA